MIKYTKRLIPLMLCIPNFFFAWSVSPSNYTIKEGDNPHYYLTVNAQHVTESTPIEVYAAKRMIDKEGHNTWERIEDRLFIYPSIFVVPPGGMQRVRVFWRGDFKDMNQEEAYRIIVEGLPVSITEGQMTEVQEGIKVGLKVLKTYVTSLFIQPKNAQANPILESHQIIEDEGKKTLILNLKNRGNKHISLDQYIVTLKSEGGSFEINQDHILKTNEVLTLLPFHERECVIPLPTTFPLDFPLDSYEVKFKILSYR